MKMLSAEEARKLYRKSEDMKLSDVEIETIYLDYCLNKVIERAEKNYFVRIELESNPAYYRSEDKLKGIYRNVIRKLRNLGYVCNDINYNLFYDGYDNDVHCTFCLCWKE